VKIHRNPIYQEEDFRQAIFNGLESKPKKISPKFFYDLRGSQLFEKIVQQPEYYIPNLEYQVVHDNIEEISQLVGKEKIVIEYGSGASKKIRSLLDHLTSVSCYVPVDIAENFLIESIQTLQKDYPSLKIHGVSADYTQGVQLPDEILSLQNQRLIFFPGSTIGNLEPERATELLRSIQKIAGKDGQLLVGIDLQKDTSILEAAYNDEAGVTAQFNLNFLERIKTEIGSNLDSTQFAHRAFYNTDKNRIEMHLVSKRNQEIEIGEKSFSFLEGESIHTENSYKFSLNGFRQMAKTAGFESIKAWTDPQNYFAVCLFQTKSPDEKI